MPGVRRLLEIDFNILVNRPGVKSMSQRIIVAKCWLVLDITTSFIAVARQSVTSVPGASSIQSERAAKPLDPEQALADLRG